MRWLTLADSDHPRSALRGGGYKLIGQVEALKERQICPHLKYIGIVATKYREGFLAGNASQQGLDDDLRKKGIQTSMLPSTAFIPQTVALVREADEGIERARR